MNSKFTKPSNSVSGTLVPCNETKQFPAVSDQPKSFRFSKKTLALALIVLSFCGVHRASAQLNLNFGTNYKLKSGTDGALNAKYLYTKVNDTMDCIVTIKEINGGASLYAFDDNSGDYGGTVARFQPIISISPNDNNTSSYIKFNFQLIKTGTYSNGAGTNIIPSDPVWFRAYDVDGNGVDNGVREFVELSSAFTGSWVDAPSLLVSKTAVTTGGSAYTISNSNINGGDLSDTGTLAFNGFIYANTVSSWDVIGGSTVGSDAPDCSKHLNDGDRINSWSFNYQEVIPGVDFGDAPSSYSAGATPVVPAYHVVPSVKTNCKVYLGAIKPDIDYDPSGNIYATTDDKNNITDDEDGYQSTYFPKYSGTGAYTCTISATNTSGSNAYIYGFIDFNGNGIFDANETSNKITVPSNNGALQYFTATFPAGFTYTVTAAYRFARFRIGSTASEVATPNGRASNGEVEDYRFNTAIRISGTVYDDGNGTTDSKINGTAAGIAGATQLYVILVDTSGKVLQSVPVASGGGYTLDSAGCNSTFKVVLSSTNLTIGSTYSANTLPAAYVFTSAGVTATTPAGNGSSTGNFTTTIGSSDVNTMDFGWDALPETVNKSASINSPNNATKYPLTTAPLAGSDPETSPTAGSIGTGGTFIINTLPSGATLYYNGTAVTAGQTITNYTPALLTVQFSSNGTKTFTYSTVDAAGKAGPTPATYTITLSAVLPLNDIVLSANQLNGTVKLTLVATDESKVARYTWEQSTDGATYTVLGSTPYQTTNASTNVYTFTNTPGTAANLIYYRSVQYSLDGSTLASNVVVVKLTDRATSQAVAMPNIIKDIANIKMSSTNGETISLNIADNIGRVVIRKQVTLSAGSNTFAVDGWDKLSNGAYYIQLIGTSSQSVLKVMVQH